jgi:hypothetical protein
MYGDFRDGLWHCISMYFPHLWSSINGPNEHSSLPLHAALAALPAPLLQPRGFGSHSVARRFFGAQRCWLTWRSHGRWKAIGELAPKIPPYFGHPCEFWWWFLPQIVPAMFCISFWWIRASWCPAKIYHSDGEIWKRGTPRVVVRLTSWDLTGYEMGFWMETRWGLPWIAPSVRSS